MSRRDPVDLTNCDREPIHIPGSIQPHGALIATDAAARMILRRSANVEALLGIGTDATALEEAFGREMAHTLRNGLARCQEGGRPAVLFGLTLATGRFDVSFHRFRGTGILEFEPAQGAASEPLELARAMISRITTIKSVDRLLRDTSRLFSVLLGYDRVMVYQFGHDNAGKVVSETKRGDLESFLGQYFPASDIPQQARALYLKNTIRIITDAEFQPIPITPELDASGEPLDLSHAHLRSVSPIHCEYLRNMGVAASMSVSIIIDGALWGLVACHHYSPRVLNVSERIAAELFGEFLSLQLASLRHAQALAAATEARRRLDVVLRDASSAVDITATLRERVLDFADLIAADGAALSLDGQWTATGAVPPDAAVPLVTGLAARVCDGAIWATHKLSDALPAAEDFAAEAAGVLMIPLSRRPRDYLFFFRKEVVQTLDWAGNPEKTYTTGPLGDRLTPRRSFAIWKETVHAQSAPWTEDERAFAEAVRSALTEVLLAHSEMLADERERAAVRQRVLNDELNHRVKNILAVIKSLVSRSTAGDTLETYVSSLRARIQSLSLAHDQVIRGDGGGDLRDLFAAELSPYLSEAGGTVIEGPGVWLEARAYSVLALVIHELSTNAAKYGALSRPGGSVAARWTLDDEGNCDITWREAGGPPVRAPSRRGFGTLLIDRSIPYDLGGASAIRYTPAGVEADLRIPPRFVAPRSAPFPPEIRTDRPAEGSAVTLSGQRVLIVEDQMLIALELEAALEAAGLVVAGIARSSAEALAMLPAAAPDLAVLDVNLGTDTSAAIAARLAADAVPFLFATGYGEAQEVVEAHDVPVVRKPYDQGELLAGLKAALARSSG